MTTKLGDRLAALWRIIRTVTGDDAYERYLEHWREHHADEGVPLSRKAFYRAELQRRWSSVRRCC
ncbi:YbdD/YjiX family protein [Methylococcus mesophilus]|uniref:YbdD/YjiX family protein n=1 Tax=Methylococcus mesophilus TaxID=2993564 RepID=UPI00224AAE88|nr:YbdD/YjiX family protein [Methylococcus mesophilus]UZR27365.1 YbdD/YjiX family protein [Methylococcus mesophilus]